MIRIKTAATTANIGPGFDCLGMALDINNEYTFEESQYMELIGFPKEYCDVITNLVVASYCQLFDYANEKLVRVRITLKQDIPTSRGLGSSASCIVAGILAANYYLNNRYSKEELLQIATSIEGHPDNVTPLLFGGLCLSFENEDAIVYEHYDVNPNLDITLIIPNQELSTAKARSVLPKMISYHDAISNMGRLALLPKALQTGNIDELFILMQDKMHEPYRYPLIPGGDFIHKHCLEHKIPHCISGAGSTILAFMSNSQREAIKFLLDSNEYTIRVVRPYNKPTEVEEI